MKPHLLRVAFVLPLILAVTVTEASASDPSQRNPLRDANQAIQELVERVSQSVVQVVADESIGSGVVVGSPGFIMTNAHVIEGASRIEVVVPTPATSGPPKLGEVPARIVRARVIGVAREIDLALLAIDAPGLVLPAVPLADYDAVRQGELVFAFGSPDGLRDSVTMGMVSSVARQADPGSPLVYIQTDAAINPGNSGGPLVNIDGELIGINTFIATSSGGSEGLGFALPSTFVSVAYPQLRDFGRLRRATIGLSVETLTPRLAARLGLPVTAGLVVTEVLERSPGDVAGLKRGDVITSIDQQPIGNYTISRMFLFLFTLHDGQRVTIEVRRGSTTVMAVATAIDTGGDTPVVQVEDNSGGQ
jgi:serine protease Do